MAGVQCKGRAYAYTAPFALLMVLEVSGISVRIFLHPCSFLHKSDASHYIQILMGHGETLKWMFYRFQAAAALRSEGRTDNVQEALTQRGISLSATENREGTSMVISVYFKVVLSRLLLK